MLDAAEPLRDLRGGRRPRRAFGTPLPLWNIQTFPTSRTQGPLREIQALPTLRTRWTRWTLHIHVQLRVPLFLLLPPLLHFADRVFGQLLPEHGLDNFFLPCHSVSNQDHYTSSNVAADTAAEDHSR